MQPLQTFGTSHALQMFVLAGLLLVGSASTIVQAAELVMFEAKGCTVCRSFNQDAGKDYATSAAAKILPLRRIDLHEDKIDIKLKLPVTMTPTFVFVKDGSEITRFVGYPGRKFFFQIVDTAADELRKLESRQ